MALESTHFKMSFSTASLGKLKNSIETKMKKIHIILFSLIIACKIHPSFAEELSIDVYKSPSCNCCGKWVSHLEENGFKVISHNQENVSEIKSKFNILSELQSCHTGVINGYFIEGHVPADDIKRLLSEKLNIKGLSVPGMPAGTNVPGMETKPGKANFNVLSVGDSSTKVYRHYE